MKSQRAVHCWVLLAGYSANGELNILTPGILSINLLSIWNSDELSEFYFLTGEETEEGLGKAPHPEAG